MKKITLRDGEELIIPNKAKEFLYGCCDCKLIHKIKIERKTKEIVLRFYRIN